MKFSLLVSARDIMKNRKNHSYVFIELALNFEYWLIFFLHLI